MSPFTWALLAALCWGFAPLLEKAGLQGRTDPVVGVFIRSLGVLCGALFFLPVLPRLAARLSELPLKAWICLILGGLLASIVGQLCFYRALKYGEVSRVVPVGASYPLIAFALSLVLYKEPVTLPKVIGVLLVVLGTYLLR